MTLIIGLVLVLLAATVFFYSLPRGDRVARFVGTEWEGYAVVMMVALLAVGVVMTISGVVELAN
jgi:hypothetical protein